VEEGEPLFDAIVREVREETSLDVRPIEEVCVFELRRENHAYDIHEILCVPIAPDKTPASGDDASDARWFATSELEALGVRKDAIDVIHRALVRLC
jgi:ADP-ribose pyrophosphatase YjhB (NUDIX family)